MLEENNIRHDSYIFVKYLGKSYFILKVANGVGINLEYTRYYQIACQPPYSSEYVDVCMATTTDGVVKHTNPLVRIYMEIYLNPLV